MKSTDFLAMPTDPIRAALERLISAYDEHGGRWPQHDEDALHDAVERARADLAAEPLDPAGGGEALLAAAAMEGEDNAWERAKEQAWDMYKIVGYQGEQALDDRGFDRAADLIRDEITLTRRVPAPADGEVVELAASLRRIAPQNPMGIAVQAIASSATLLEQLATAPTAPPKGEVGELVRWLQSTAEGQPLLSDEGYARLTRAATLLQQQAAELAALREGVAAVAVSERPWEREGWCDEQGRCWILSSRFLTWSLESPPVALTRQIGRLHSLPFHALPLPAPQAGEVV